MDCRQWLPCSLKLKLINMKKDKQKIFSCGFYLIGVVFKLKYWFLKWLIPRSWWGKRLSVGPIVGFNERGNYFLDLVLGIETAT